VGHSLPVLRRLQTCFVTALSSCITAKRSETTAQVNIALTKFETALQVSVLLWVLVLWDGAVKRLLRLIFGLVLKHVCLHVTLSVCLSHCTSLPACLSASLLYICLSVRLCLSVCLCLPGCSYLSLNLSVCDCLSVSLLPIYPPVRRPVPLLVCLSSRLHLCLSACLSACFFAFLYLCPPAGRSVCVYLSVVSLNIDNLQNIRDCIVTVNQRCL